jgi:hypothetical protein
VCRKRPELWRRHLKVAADVVTPVREPAIVSRSGSGNGSGSGGGIEKDGPDVRRGDGEVNFESQSVPVGPHVAREADLVAVVTFAGMRRV